MIKIKVEKNRKNEPVFKLGIKDEDRANFPILRRPLMEGKAIEGRYNYEIPLRFLVPIVNNIPKEKIKVDRYSIDTFLEFWDNYEEKYYSIATANPRFMKSWREEGCPPIYKISLDRENLRINKEVAFKRPTILGI